VYVATTKNNGLTKKRRRKIKWGMERFFQEIWVAKFPRAELVLGEDNKLHHVKCIFALW
jgi:hypothetical protein